MNDAPQNARWWQASDGKWYPPKDAAPAPGWWLASDGNWYPPADDPAHQPAASESAETDSDASDGSTGPAGRGARNGRRSGRGKTPPPKAPPVNATAPPPATGPASETSGAAVPAASMPTLEPEPTTKRLPTPRPNPHEGVSPEDQIARRNLASQADAAVLARSRSIAASRLLASVSSELAATTSSNPTPTSGKVPNAPKTTAPKSDPTNPPSPAVAAKGTPPTASGAGLGPLLEVKQSALASDVDHLGERLAIFNDRVELRDRHDRVRQTVKGTEITDIVVQKKLTGAILSIETVDGPVMVAKGLRLEQAEEARSLIMRKTRPAGPVQRDNRPSARADRPTIIDDRVPGDAPGRRPEPSSAQPTPAMPHQRPIDEADVLSKLGDLHRLGILTTEEYEKKIELVGSLVRGEINLPA